MSNVKSKRIASDILKHMADIFSNTAKNDLFKKVTIIAVDVTKDLSHAKVYFTSIVELDPKEVEKELNKAAGFIRKELAGTMNLRHTPELSFRYDSSIDYGNNIERILSEIHLKKENDNKCK